MVAVGTYLQERRKAAGLTQEDVARRLGVVSKTVSDWEAGRYSPGFDLMVRLVGVIGGKIDDVVRHFLRDEPGGADEVLTRAERDSVLALATTDAKRAALLRRIAQMSDDPELRARIEGYLDGLEGQPRQ